MRRHILASHGFSLSAPLSKRDMDSQMLLNVIKSSVRAAIESVLSRVATLIVTGEILFPCQITLTMIQDKDVCQIGAIIDEQPVDSGVLVADALARYREQAGRDGN